MTDPIGFNSQQIAIILVETETPGNIGSITRVMKNFSYSKLILFNPPEGHNCHHTKGFAMKGADILDNAEVVVSGEEDPIQTLKKLFQRFDVVIGTSAKGISYKNIKRIPIFVRELQLGDLGSDSKVAIVFGRESTGLSNDEIILTDFTIKIPANPEYPTLNIAQAAGIILYDLYVRTHEITHSQVRTASKKDKDTLLAQIKSVVERVPLKDCNQDRTLHAMKNLFGRAFMSQKECSLIYALFDKIRLGLDNPKLLNEELASISA